MNRNFEVVWFGAALSVLLQTDLGQLYLAAKREGSMQRCRSAALCAALFFSLAANYRMTVMGDTVIIGSHMYRSLVHGHHCRFIYEHKVGKVTVHTCKI